MPAPTALLQPTPAPEAVPLPAPEQEDELLVDMQEASTTEPSAVAPPTTADDTDMAIDEEGRPRFAPGKDVVCREGLNTEDTGRTPADGSPS
jgi:RNA-binding protein PNO1